MTQKKNHLKQQKTGIVSWIVFLVTISLVVITLTSVIFPAFILGSTSEIKYPIEINIFETGLWAYPVISANIIVFGLLILYYKNKLPTSITKLIKFIFNFEVSKRVAFWFIVSIIAIYIGFSIEEVFAKDPWIDYERYQKPQIDKWTPTSFRGTVTDTYLTFAFAKVSGIVFGEYAVSAFMASIVLLVLTYLLILEITKKRFAGLVAMIVLLQSGNFLIYDTTITYPNFWVVFLVLSLYMVYKKWPLSHVSFLLSLPSKFMSSFYFPVILFFAYRANIPKRNKKLIFVTYGVIAIIAFIVLQFSGFVSIPTGGDFLEFDQRQFMSGLTAFSYQFRFDGIILMFLLPLTVGLFIASRHGIKEADSILVLLTGPLLFAALMTGFSGYTNNPYRFMPFVVFFAMGVGTLLSRRRING